jgi:hypothetical protein
MWFWRLWHAERAGVGNGLSGEIVKNEASAWPYAAKVGDPDRSSVLMTSCCPCVG